MLIKEEGDGWSRRINFIDKNDAFVGFDYSSCCCEHFGWYAADIVTNEEPSEEPSLDGFWFDTGEQPIDVEGTDKWGEDNAIAFKCVNEAGAVRYLHLYNHHNGYYSHGWDASWGLDGSL